MKIQGEKPSLKFEALKTLCQENEVSLHTLIEALQREGLALLTLIFSLPFLLPIPIPGLSIIFGLIIGSAGIGLFLERRPLPSRKMLEKKISGKLLRKILDAGIKICQFLEKFSSSRGVSFLRPRPWIKKVIGLLIACCGFFLALPLPPGTNLPPAAAILMLSLGLLEEDLLFILAGHFLFLVNLVLFGGIFYWGVNG